MPRSLVRQVILDHSVTNARLADALLDAMRDEVLREAAALLRKKGYEDAAAEIDPDRMTGTANGPP